MLSRIVKISLQNKLSIFILTFFIIGAGLYSLFHIPIGAVPDITNNQVQVITTSRNLSTQDVEQFITYPVELAMTNLPGVKEIRSISKFGLSVVTIVFEDELGTYLPRQLIEEKIKDAKEKIPEAFGTPQMGPISTGLGEIYQYILDVTPEYKDQYSIMDLRTIQDWIVKRQLSGIPGVVEVNTWGGFLKQYEVAIDPEKLSAMNLSMNSVFEALENNNNIAGGGYIEKSNQSYFIRGEGLMKSLDDIEQTVVKSDNIPILIKDIATVRYGSATRFGAITGNGEGEKVLGQILMLKGGNSNEVIKAVKERVNAIQNALPKGVMINGFLDRSELIKRTSTTISENLILGSLMVIFVVVLLLGNFRSGLIVASVIPLSLLFALSLMRFFGVDANLMSLGAIDFGIIIDGAVIIVEFIAFKIKNDYRQIENSNSPLPQNEIDAITHKSASKMMNSAIFGQLIIFIVFIPILALSGIEGKLFKPMALTFSFALVGAILLCLTYVPVVASLFLKPKKLSDKNISVRLMKSIEKRFSPSLDWALRNKLLVLGFSVLLFVISISIFSKMGGEFVPTLDEGDFVIQPVLKTGTSLQKTIEITTEIESILLDNFVEVDQVVSRIGAAEVPTDPMSMEESDIIIKLKPKKDWVNATSKDELANQFKDALAVIPEMEVEFTQPIEMRFNELITGVRADVAIKIFGEDLSILAQKAEEIKTLIEDVPGASDISVEKVEGLPQMQVEFDRSKIARHGLSIADINKVIAMGFGGATLGSVFEGEKRFDLVLRFSEQKRADIESLKNLYIDSPRGYKVPLRELASIQYTSGPAKISRDDTKRRIVVGINVRDRDLQSVVKEVQEMISSKIALPVGYHIDYGGQFENLENAKNRLLVAVPIALILIFVLLYFAFNSVSDALLVYSAIPLAAVGGVLLLWFRNMPFSISAGVGFIALFGIAVLNGIVLIEHFKELKKEGMTNLEQIIKEGTKQRLRPVILTAAAAALGFLPMALSTNAGAEVQRPLATVVIGGLITATLLTLFVLPVLYAWQQERKQIKLNKSGTLLIVFCLYALGSQGQERVTVEELVNLAISNNASVKAAKLKVKEKEALVKTAFDFDKTEVYYGFDENNIAINDLPIRVFGIGQDFKFPSFYSAEKKVKEAEKSIEEIEYKMTLLELKKKVYLRHSKLIYAKNKVKTYAFLDSLFQNFSKNAKKSFQLGDVNYLEFLTAKTKHKQINSEYRNALQEEAMALKTLQTVVQNDDFIIEENKLRKLELKSYATSNNLGLLFWNKKQDLQYRLYKKEQQNRLPDISLSYFQGSNNQLNATLEGYQIGLKIPLFYKSSRAKIKAAKFAQESAVAQSNDYQIILENTLQNLLSQLQQRENTMSYYETEGLVLKKELIKTANRSLKAGEIDFYQYIQSLETAQEIQLSYLKNLQLYNETIININYLLIKTSK